MAVNFIWPADLPQLPLQDGYGETVGVLVARTKADKGPAKQRRLGQRPDVLSVSYGMSSEQEASFRAFVVDTLRGVRRFGWPHPRLNVQQEVRIVPADDGQLYALAPMAPGHYRVTFSLEILP